MKKYIRILAIVAWGFVPAVAGDIYYGDLHTHSNLSADAVLLQTIQGLRRGPEAACSYAQICAQVDFYGQSDHAEMMDRTQWGKSVDAVNECNARFAPTDQSIDPEMVVFHGFEWTASMVGDKYWGHKNVFFRNDTIPEIPVGAYTIKDTAIVSPVAAWEAIKVFGQKKIGLGTVLRSVIPAASVQGFERCRSMSESEIDSGCIRVADDPATLWDVLEGYYQDSEYQAGNFDVIAIPHGTAWGMGKLGADWTIQLNQKQHNPRIQRLVEVYSGHGNSEEYRDFANREGGYESCNVRAGRLAWAHCLRKGGMDAECRPEAIQAARTGNVSFPTSPKDWGTCGECPDCYQPAERYMPMGSVQAGMAMSGFDKQGNPQTRFQFGFIAATDDHSSRPASVMEDKDLTDWGGATNFQVGIRTPFAPAGRFSVESERVGSYFYPGGLVGVHAERRTRDAIFDALEARAVFGTSGTRMRLWFSADLDEQHAFMGQRVTGTASPQFSFEAWGGPEEMPGCNDNTIEKWGRRTIEDICQGTCYNPKSYRTGIDRIEVIKITPQISPDEKLRPLIQDPYMVIRNDARRSDGTPTAVFKGTFSDPAYTSDNRDALYYIRAIQVPTPSVNGTPLRDNQGGFSLCIDDGEVQCHSMAEERAWSSPVYVDFGR